MRTDAACEPDREPAPGREIARVLEAPDEAIERKAVGIDRIGVVERGRACEALAADPRRRNRNRASLATRRGEQRQRRLAREADHRAARTAGAEQAVLLRQREPCPQFGNDILDRTRF